MSMRQTESKGGVVVATCTNPPMNYFCAEGTRELGGLIEQWKSPDVRVVILTGGMTGKFITHTAWRSSPSTRATGRRCASPASA